MVSGNVSHARAVCPECDEKAVTVMVAPMKPPKMECTNCGWDSLGRPEAARRRTTTGPVDRLTSHAYEDHDAE